MPSPPPPHFICCTSQSFSTFSPTPNSSSALLTSIYLLFSSQENLHFIDHSTQLPSRNSWGHSKVPIHDPGECSSPSSTFQSLLPLPLHAQWLLIFIFPQPPLSATSSQHSPSSPSPIHPLLSPLTLLLPGCSWDFLLLLQYPSPDSLSHSLVSTSATSISTLNYYLLITS